MASVENLYPQFTLWKPGLGQRSPFAPLSSGLVMDKTWSSTVQDDLTVLVFLSNQKVSTVRGKQTTILHLMLPLQAESMYLVSKVFVNVKLFSCDASCGRGNIHETRCTNMQLHQGHFAIVEDIRIISRIVFKKIRQSQVVECRIKIPSRVITR